MLLGFAGRRETVVSSMIAVQGQGHMNFSLSFYISMPFGGQAK
jgi:hypothetical protein